MTYTEAVFFVTGLLYLERRVSYRRLTQEFGLDADTIDFVRHELTLGRRVAVDDSDTVLVWTGERPAPPATPAPESARTRTDHSAHPEAERRQLTVMFCDLVGSTALSQRLDPEDLREIIGAFQDACRDAVHRYDGFIARYMGDGVLVYFGYPQASEHDADRAVRAGLDVIVAMPALSAAAGTRHAVELAVRIGIATGPVVVGDIVGEGAAEEAAVLGETPNLAARLQSIAAPNQLVVSERTHRLLGARFTCEDAGTHTLKGIGEPTHAWRVSAQRDDVRDEPGDADAALDTARAGPLIGRQAELELLTRAWESSKDHHGQVVLIQGDAGIGKSRLIEALRAEAAGTPYTWVAIRCSPYHANSVLYPVIEQLKRALHWQADDAPAERLAKLEQALAAQSLPLAEVIPLFAELLSLPLPEARYPAPALSAKEKREATLDALIAWLLDEAERHPVLQVWEDLHWADPTTLELFALHIEQSPTAAILNVATYRPEFTPPWPMRSHLTPITLNRLERAEVEALIAQQTQDKPLPGEVVEHIVARADGVPLYVEELTRAILQSECVFEENNCYLLNGSLGDLVIPETLQDSLMARLDRVPTAREVAQLGAVIGREFAYEILQPLAPLDEAVLQQGLSHLVQNELLYQRGRPPRARYIFKHALIQDAAYQSLLRKTRQRHHHRLANLLEQKFPETVDAHPEVIAQHCTEAGEHRRAVDYWQGAGERAQAQSANLEAIGHFGNGLDALAHLDDTPERARRELELQLALGNAQLVAKGHGAVEVEQAYRRARDLCETLGDTAELLPTLFGLWRYNIVAQPLARAGALGDELWKLARVSGETAPQVMAHYAIGFTAFARGRLHDAKSHLEASSALYDPTHRATAPVYRAAQDPGVACRMYRAINDWLLGAFEQAREGVDASIALAREIEDPLSEAHALAFGAICLEMLGDLDRSLECGRRAENLGTEKGYSAFRAYGAASAAWAEFREAPAPVALDTLREKIEVLPAIGFLVMVPYFRTLIARAEQRLGRIDAALQTLDDANALAERRDEHWWDAETARLRGELLLAQDPGNGHAAERCYEQALKTAREQGARAAELRAAISLARLWHDRGDCARVVTVLHACDTFTDSHDAPDLIEARNLLHACKDTDKQTKA